MGASSVLCKRPFFLVPQAIGAVGKWESWVWISTFPWPTVILSFRLSRLRLGTTGFRLGPSLRSPRALFLLPRGSLLAARRPTFPGGGSRQRVLRNSIA